ncbi:Ras-related protein Rab-9A [Harpegnathos saltator]|uniref:Ras-related protein Rab-9A n=1 Tax=Harpegnathos saltator TaxID=610380 RepID=E2BH83_HARSA|nr:Ras-related protein Rab-9A [Harpegnathos saltator]
MGILTSGIGLHHPNGVGYYHPSGVHFYRPLGAREEPRSTFLKTIIFGDKSVDDFCIAEALKANKTEIGSATRPTGVEISSKTAWRNDEKYIFQFWTIDRKNCQNRRLYYGMDICILCYSINDRMSYLSLKVWKQRIHHYIKSEEIATFPFIVIAVDTPIPDARRRVPKKEKLAQEKWCRKHNMLYFVVSSVSNAINTDEILNAAITRWKEHDVVQGVIQPNINLENSMMSLVV